MSLKVKPSILSTAIRVLFLDELSYWFLLLNSQFLAALSRRLINLSQIGTHHITPFQTIISMSSLGYCPMTSDLCFWCLACGNFYQYISNMGLSFSYLKSLLLFILSPLMNRYGNALVLKVPLTVLLLLSIHFIFLCTKKKGGEICRNNA